MTLHQRASARGVAISASTDDHLLVYGGGPVAKHKPTFQQRIKDVFPILAWLPTYDLRNLKFDILAGIAAAMIVIPQEISLANDMHVRTENGLYTAATAPLVYALFGSSTVLSVASGPEVCLLVGTALSPIGSEEERIATGVFTSFLVGLILLLLRFLNLSQISGFFSRPVMGATVTASGFLIMLSRLPVWFSIDNGHANFPHQSVYNVFAQLHKIEKNAFVVGLLSIIFLASLRVTKQRCFPAPPAASILSVRSATAKKLDDDEEIPTPVPETQHNDHDFSRAEAQYMSLNADRVSNDDSPTQVSAPPATGILSLYVLARTFCDAGPSIVFVVGGIVGYYLGAERIQLVGEVPSGLPTLIEPWYGFNQGLIPHSELGNILYKSLSIAAVIFLTSAAMAKRRALQRSEEIRTDQELLGLGVAAVVCGFTRAMVSSGDPTRTGLNSQNGKTQLASVVTTAIVILVLYTLTDAMFYLPRASLAAVIFMVGYSMVDFREAKWLFRVRRDEFYVWTASFVLTLGLGAIYGLTASIVAAGLGVMWKTKRAPVVILGELDNGNVVDCELYPEAKHLLDVVLLRVEKTLHFANCERVAPVVDEELTRFVQYESEVKGVVLDVFSMDDLDATTLQMLSDLQEKLAKRQIGFAVANARGKVHDIIASTLLIDRLAGQNPCLRVNDAIQILRGTHAHGESAATSHSSSDLA